ncbi:MAG: Dam family site-specific DNA-(adenine-N6)-methyltransferase [Prevotella sp.]|uniref:DNA adenine methylase n=1 Tax=Prevotella sp. TaxID=59823 RepID=UPI002A292104|nr:Dam family site-specific DNA-(adenine-N6)-methyltransferase [Prevotella sp.]MDD7317936.1 Dam family site-specific DNA-(adenine-N6)-methyltransferase [Prevotellaceae bacterium]MDY4020827.1 Dam family site-specific DNA-(adenine-N6)-methyltransferase [Prevotella sp.]
MKKEIVRSPLFYVGDKYKLVGEIKTHLPKKINRFIEPFVGGGSVFMNIDAGCFLLNDIDANVISIHKMLCGYVGHKEDFYREFFSLVEKYNLSLSYKENIVPDELKKAYPKTYFAKYNKEAYVKLREDFNKGNVKDFMMLYALLIYGFNRMLRFNKKGDFNLPVGDVDFNQNTYNALEDYFKLLEKKTVEWSSMDFVDFLVSVDYAENDLIYLDPPYLITSSEYNKLWNYDKEQAMLSLLDSLDARHVRFAISNVTHYRGNVNEAFQKWSKKYNTYPIKSNYISFNDNTIKKFNEVLVTNF